MKFQKTQNDILKCICLFCISTILLILSCIFFNNILDLLRNLGKILFCILALVYILLTFFLFSASVSLIVITVILIWDYLCDIKELNFIKENLYNEFSLIRIIEDRFYSNSKSELSIIINEAIKDKISKDILCYARITEDDIIIVRYIDKVSKETIKDEKYTNYNLFLSMFEFI